jgi:hypothetical protein
MADVPMITAHCTSEASCTPSAPRPIEVSDSSRNTMAQLTAGSKNAELSLSKEAHR